MPDTSSLILDKIERLLLIALRVGDRLRNPKRYVGVEDDTEAEVGFACGELDALGCSWAIQNSALCYINDADTPKVWDELHSRQLSAIARDLLSKAPEAQSA